MSRDELVDLTRQGVLKTPVADWNRPCMALAMAGALAVVRAEAPWSIDFSDTGRFDGRWIVVNALWHAQPRTPAPASS